METRKLKLTITPIKGGITLVYVFIDGHKVVADSSGKECKWDGEVPNKQVTIKLRIVGIDDAEAKIGIDLPGTINDQEFNVQLNGGYYEMEFTL